jgi:hypothetical protein
MAFYEKNLQQDNVQNITIHQIKVLNYNLHQLALKIKAQDIHTCQVTRFGRVTPGNRAGHPHFPLHP